MTTSDVIHTQGLSKTYEEVHALKSLDLHVPEKSIFAFLGPNGSGKTTTIKQTDCIEESKCRIRLSNPGPYRTVKEASYARTMNTRPNLTGRYSRFARR